MIHHGDPDDGLGSLTELGPFFGLSAFPEPERAGDWRPLAVDLRTGDHVERWVADTRARFAAGLGLDPSAISERAVRSALHLGLCARLLSPWFAMSVLARDLATPRWDALLWQPDGTTRFPLAAPPAEAPSPTPESLVERLLVPLHACGLVTSPHVAWGNAVSALNGATVALSRHDAAYGDRAREVAERIVAAFPLGTYSGRFGGPTFRRRSCCLINSLTPDSRAAICQDCILSPT